MRCTIKGELLKEAALLANVAAKSKSNVIESQCVLFECDGEKLRLAATDMWKVFVECFSKSIACCASGSVAIAAKSLKTLVKEVKPYDEVELERTGDYEVVARWGNGREMSLFAHPADGFPLIVNAENIENSPPFFLGTGETLVDALRKVGFAAATDEVRYGVLVGVHFHCDGNEVHVVASDTYRLSLYRYPLTVPSFRFTIPPYTTKVASTIFDGASVVNARVGNGIVEFSALKQSLWKLCIVTVEGNYPNYMRVVNFHSGNPYAVKFSVSDLRQVLGDKEVEKIVFEFSPPETQTQVVMLIPDPSQPTGWAVKKTVNIQVDWLSMPDKPIAIAFNPRYITDFVKAAGFPYVIMRFGKPNSATEWQTEQDYWQVLIMPMLADW